MRCPHCSHMASRVLDSRPTEGENTTRRRRRCDGCNARFTTYERVALQLPAVLKRSGRRETFSTSKIRMGVELACRKRPITTLKLDAFMAELEGSFRALTEEEVSSISIGEAVLARLRTLDEVAYVRFASVYREFPDVQHFVLLLKGLQDDSERST